MPRDDVNIYNHDTKSYFLSVQYPPLLPHAVYSVPLCSFTQRAVHLQFDNALRLILKKSAVFKAGVKLSMAGRSSFK